MLYAPSRCTFMLRSHACNKIEVSLDKAYFGSLFIYPIIFQIGIFCHAMQNTYPLYNKVKERNVAHETDINLSDLRVMFQVRSIAYT